MEWLYGYLRTADRYQEIDWRDEAEAAEDLKFNCHSFDFEALLEGRAEEAVRDLPEGDGGTLVYRGWMMRDEEYVALEQAVADLNYTLFTPSHAYRLATFLPQYYDAVADLTMPARWTEEPDVEEAWELAQELGKGPWVVKDHVKSHKEAWLTACYVERDATYEAFAEVCENFAQFRGARFEGGYVVRPYRPLKMIAAHASGMPVFEEYRLVFWKGELLISDNYAELEVGDELPQELSRFHQLGDRVDSPFFVADVARQESGELILIELNDGGTAGLPPKCHPYEFYAAVAKAEGREVPEDDLW